MFRNMYSDNEENGEEDDTMASPSKCNDDAEALDANNSNS